VGGCGLDLPGLGWGPVWALVHTVANLYLLTLLTHSMGQDIL
jgi:hypothetical protein